MIKITKSQTADTRSCDPKTVTKEQLRKSSEQHIGDVCKAIDFFTATTMSKEEAMALPVA